MNDKLLTGARKQLFLLVAETPLISKADLCAFSWARGGNIQRINHHLCGLLSEGFIRVAHCGKRGKSVYCITKGKGEQMLKFLQQAEGEGRRLKG